MKVQISANSRRKVYHLSGCRYARNIGQANRQDMAMGQAAALGYRGCRCCCTVKARVRSITNSLELAGRGRRMELTFNRNGDTLFMRTERGLWKTYWKENCGLLLYHLNRFDPQRSTKQLSWGDFHRQNDVKATPYIENILSYVEDHDRAKGIIAEDYRRLPQQTRRQRKYYRQAERRERRNQVRRVWDIFEALERERQMRPGTPAGRVAV